MEAARRGSKPAPCAGYYTRVAQRSAIDTPPYSWPSTGCRFGRELRALPALPEMVFPDSWLRLDHESGCGLAFYALDALLRVDTSHDPLKVAAAEEWSKTR